MKDLMINKIKEINSKAKESGDHFVTRLYYTHNGKREYVEDFSPYANEDYMSRESLEALANGQTMTRAQEFELHNWVLEQEYVLVKN